MLRFTYFCQITEKYAAPTAAHGKQIIEMLKNSKCLGAVHITLWENKDSCAGYYRCDT